MSRFTALTSILTAGLALALAPAALAQGIGGGPGGVAPPPPVDAKQMAASIRAQMTGNAFGYQFAIAQDGKLVPGNATTDKRAGGFARSDADTVGSGGLPMTNTMRYELASFTKNPVALSTMKLLRLHGLTIKSPIEPWLPADWKRGAALQDHDVPAPARATRQASTRCSPPRRRTSATTPSSTASTTTRGPA